MKHKNVLLVVFFLTSFVFQQVQAGGGMPDAGKLSDVSIPRLNSVLFETVRIKIYPLNLGNGQKSSEIPCSWDTNVDGCGDAPPVWSSNPNLQPGQTPYPVVEDGYYFLDIELDYLPNVLPNEINLAQIRPPEPEALKAQAVAARTFTSYKAKFFTFIDNSINFQVYVPGSKKLTYNGTSYQAEIDSAVTTTAGQFLQYNSPCPPPNDAYTCHAIDAEFSSDIIGQSVNGNQPYLVTVQELISSSTCNLLGAAGNGWGMSQRGAIRWAKGNTCPDGSGNVWPVKWNYKQILVHYYTEVDLINDNTGSKVAPDNRWNLLHHNIPAGIILPPNQPIQFTVRIQNTSASNIPNWGGQEIKVWYKWDNGSWNDTGIYVPAIQKGSDQSFTVENVVAPSNGGEILHLDLRRQNESLFSQQSPAWPDAMIAIHVDNPAATTSAPPTLIIPSSTASATPPTVQPTTPSAAMVSFVSFDGTYGYDSNDVFEYGGPYNNGFTINYNLTSMDMNDPYWYVNLQVNYASSGSAVGIRVRNEAQAIGDFFYESQPRVAGLDLAQMDPSIWATGIQPDRIAKSGFFSGEGIDT